ncbi:MAG: hypothetical protein NXH97_05290 [Rhodobacteraceae bacterium]|nr:hypothetical protein [Paracoccaceae bacterium]
MTTTTEMIDTAPPQTSKPSSLPAPLRVTPDEIKAYGAVGVIAALWIGITVLFGFGGLIIGALIMVALAFVTMILISRG